MKSTTFLNTNKFEIQANRFAAELLIPDNRLAEYKDYGFSLTQIAADLNVSKYLLELKLNK